MQMNMEINTCNVNHVDADALLPPRKRLLAGLKRQNSDVNSPPAVSTPIRAESENYTHLNDPWRPQMTIPNLSNEDIVEASRIAAIKAAKVAETARANAEEKAAKAAKAVAAAKTALDLVATIGEDKEKYLKKNKTKKQMPVEALYNKKKRNANCRTDEELAHKLHRAINSSPRISKSPSASNMKNSQKHKKMKASRNTVGSEVKVGERNQPSSTTIISADRVVGDVAPIKEIDMIMVDLNTPRTDKGGEKSNNGEQGQTSKSERLKLDNSEVLDVSSKKRGRIKQKKLPLSICSFRDRNGPREEPKLLEDNAARKAVVDQPLFSNGTSLMPPVERTTSMWKCQKFKSPACVKQN